MIRAGYFIPVGNIKVHDAGGHSPPNFAAYVAAGGGIKIASSQKWEGLCSCMGLFA